MNILSNIAGFIIGALIFCMVMLAGIGVTPW